MEHSSHRDFILPNVLSANLCLKVMCYNTPRSSASPGPEINQYTINPEILAVI